MDRNQVAQILAETAALLELTGANAFKVRAYENAARAVEGLADDVAERARAGTLTEIKGIGKNIAAHIAELVAHGRFEEYEELRKAVPAGVLEMLAIPGLGPKKVHHLWRGMELTTIAQLEKACRSGRVADEEGFGKRSAEKILEGIETIKRFAGRFLYAEAAAIAEEVHAAIAAWPEVIRSEVAGSVRRRKELVKDIDILVATDDAKAVMEHFVALPQVLRVVEHGRTKSEVLLAGGIQCDLRTTADAEYPFALHHFTGSKEHNIALRSLAKKRKIKVSEYGLFKGTSKKTIPCADEAALFGVFDLDYIEPELREDMGELEAAAEHRLPTLVERRDLKGVLHAHSTYTDGRASIAEMAEGARERGFSYLVLADHSQAVTVAGGMKPATVKKQHKEIDALNEKLRNFRVIKGIEVDILPDGSLDYDDEVMACFEFVIAAIHSRFGMSEEEMTARIITGISHPSVDLLAHPTGRLLLERDPYRVDLARVIDACVEQGTAIEINAHPRRLDLDWRWCKHAKESGVRLAICPDAHDPAGFDDVALGLGIARKGWLEKGDLLNCRSAEQLLTARARRMRRS